MRRLATLVLLTMGLVATAACTPPAETPTVVPPETLATYQGGRVTADDLDQAVLTLPLSERASLGTTATEPFEPIIRDLAFRRLVLAEARTQGLDQAPEALAEVEGLRRQALATAYLNTTLPALQEPSVDELRAAFEARREKLDQPEVRTVFHLFKRASGTDQGPALAALQSIRRRVLAGENFGLIATEESDSEARHQQGFIGRIIRGQLPPEFERVIFALEEKIPSEPVTTADGIHLFFVEAIVPARSPAFEEIRANLRQELLAQRRQAAVDALLETLEPPPGSFVPTEDEFRALLGTGDPQALVLRLGDFEMRLGRFGRLVAREQETLPSSQRLTQAAAMPGRVLAALHRREAAYLAALAAGATLTSADEDLIDRQAEQLLFERYQRQLVERALDDQPERLEAFYQDNRQRFTSPLRWSLRRLVLPVADDSSTVMGELEARIADLETGQTDLETVARQVGAEIEDLGWHTLQTLTLFDAKMALFAGRLPKGGFSPPYTTPNGEIALFEVVDRREPEVVSFAEAQSSVRASYLQRHGREIYDEVTRAKLDGAGFITHPANITRAVNALTPAVSGG